jgi:hypothetical protein
LAEVKPAIPGVGEVWVDTQFERVPNQKDVNGTLKPRTSTVMDAATFTVEREINGKRAGGTWNNPHNMWANFALSSVYNGNWCGEWINKIDRSSGRILNKITSSLRRGAAPAHEARALPRMLPPWCLISIFRSITERGRIA